MMRLLLCLFFLFPIGLGQGKAQAADSSKALLIGNQLISWQSMGRTKIYLKDGTVKIKCTVREVRSMYVLYEKDGVLHDLQLDRIDHLEIPDQKFLIYFNTEKRPIIRYYSRND